MNEEYREHLTLSGCDTPGFTEVETAYKRVINEQPVEIIIRTRITQDSNRTVRQTEKRVLEAATALIETLL